MTNRIQKTLAFLLLLSAAAFLAAGTARMHKVYDDDKGTDFGLLTFQKISDRQLVIDTTFGGTTRKGDKLYSTYDRSEVKGKRPCPT